MSLRSISNFLFYLFLVLSPLLIALILPRTMVKEMDGEASEVTMQDVLKHNHEGNVFVYTLVSSLPSVLTLAFHPSIISLS